MYNLEYYQGIVKEQFQNLKITEYPEGLYEPVRYTLSLGGKRIRPLLCVISCDLCGGNINNALQAAVALELFHNFTLIHDDIMDNAPIRRGKPTVFKKWGANTAILSGDTMFAMAFVELSKAPAPIIKDLTEILSETAIEVCEGQQYDMDFENSEIISTNDYLEMIRLKTSVLIAASFKMGALCAGADTRLINGFYEFGEKLGLAFQIQDDFLDNYGDESKFGKKTGGDIVENKKTYLFVKALEDADETQRLRLLKLYASGSLTSDKKVLLVNEIYKELDIKEKVSGKINDLFDESVQILNNMPLSSEAVGFLTDFARNLVNRDK